MSSLIASLHMYMMILSALFVAQTKRTLHSAYADLAMVQHATMNSWMMITCTKRIRQINFFPMLHRTHIHTLICLATFPPFILLLLFFFFFLVDAADVCVIPLLCFCP